MSAQGHRVGLFNWADFVQCRDSGIVYGGLAMLFAIVHVLYIVMPRTEKIDLGGGYYHEYEHNFLQWVSEAVELGDHPWYLPDLLSFVLAALGALCALAAAVITCREHNSTGGILRWTVWHRVAKYYKWALAFMVLAFGVRIWTIQWVDGSFSAWWPPFEWGPGCLATAIVNALVAAVFASKHREKVKRLGDGAASSGGVSSSSTTTSAAFSSSSGGSPPIPQAQVHAPPINIVVPVAAAVEALPMGVVHDDDNDTAAGPSQSKTLYWGTRFDSVTGQELPKFDGQTGKQNWGELKVEQRGSRFDPETGQERPRFDENTGKQNWW